MGKKQAAEEEMYFKYVFLYFSSSGSLLIMDSKLISHHFYYDHCPYFSFRGCDSYNSLSPPSLFSLFILLTPVLSHICIQGVRSRSSWLHWSSTTRRKSTTTRKKLNVCSVRSTATRERSGSWSTMTEWNHPEKQSSSFLTDPARHYYSSQISACTVSMCQCWMYGWMFCKCLKVIKTGHEMIIISNGMLWHKFLL